MSGRRGGRGLGGSWSIDLFGEGRADSWVGAKENGVLSEGHKKGATGLRIQRK